MVVCVCVCVCVCLCGCVCLCVCAPLTHTPSPPHQHCALASHPQGHLPAVHGVSPRRRDCMRVCVVPRSLPALAPQTQTRGCATASGTRILNKRKRHFSSGALCVVTTHAECNHYFFFFFFFFFYEISVSPSMHLLSAHTLTMYSSFDLTNK